MTDPQLTYGIDRETEKLVHISDAVDERVYLCPKCREELILYNHWSLDRVRKPGQRKQYFYSHKKGSNCVGAQMTVLHSLAQEILYEERKIKLPEYEGEHGYREKSVSREFEEIVLENTIVEDGLFRRPDCIARKTNGADPKHDLWIEIYVTHALDDKKILEIRERETYCIEIDMREFLYTDFTHDSLCDFLLNSPRNRKWICCPVWDKMDEEKGRIDEENEKAKKKQDTFDVDAKEVVQKWMETGREDLGEWIIEHLSVSHYFNNNFALELINIDNNVLDYILRSPKNKIGIKLFDHLLRYRYAYSPRKLESSVETTLNLIESKRINHQNYSSYDIELQELFTLVIFYYINIDRDRDYYAQGDRYILHGFSRLEKILYKHRVPILLDIIRQNKIFEFKDLDPLLIKYFPDAFINMSEKDREEAKEQQRRDEADRLFRQQQEDANDLHTERGFNKRVPNWSLPELNEHIQDLQAKVARTGDGKDKELLQKMIAYKEKHY